MDRDKKINLLIILDHLNIGGAEMLVHDFCKNLDRKKYGVMLCAFKDGELRSDFESINITPTILNRRYKFDFMPIFRLRKLIIENSIDVVHAHMYLPSIYGGIAAFLSDVKVIISSRHGLYKSRNRYSVKKSQKILYKIISTIFTKIIAVSKETKKSLIEYIKIREDKIRVIYNGIDFDRISLSKNINNLSKEFQIDDNVYKITMIGRLCDIKDYPTFLAAARIVCPSIPNALFLIVGDGSQRDMLEQLSDTLGIKNKVVFTGTCKDISEILTTSDLFVFSSNSDSFGIVLIEAMAAGVPVVATALPAIREVVEDGKTGILVPPKDPESLASAIVRLYQDKELAQILSANAKISVTKFGIKKNIRKTTKLYEQYLFRHRRN